MLDFFKINVELIVSVNMLSGTLIQSCSCSKQTRTDGTFTCQLYS